MKANSRDNELQLPKTQSTVQDVDGTCIAVTADLCIIQIGTKHWQYATRGFRRGAELVRFQPIGLNSIRFKRVFR